MPSRISVEVVSLPAPAVVAQGYFMTAERLENMVEPMFEAVEALTERYRRNFDDESSAGDKWQEWTDWYSAKRGGKVTTDVMGEEYTVGGVTKWRPTITVNKILQLSQDLYKAATDPASWDVDQSGRDAIAVLEVPEYGKFHITGATMGGLAAGGIMPVRDWSFVPDDELDYIDEIFDNYVFEG